MKQQHLLPVVYTVLVLAVILSIVNVFYLTERFGDVEEAKVLAEELMRPADLQIIRLVSADCMDCYDVGKEVAKIQNINVKVTEERTVSADSAEGQHFIQLYTLQNLPALIVTGEINKTEQLVSFFQKNGAVYGLTAVYTTLMPPYFQLMTHETKGRVSLIHVVDSACANCQDLSYLDAALKQAGVAIVDVEKVEYDSAEGKELIQQYDLTNVPSLLVSKDIDVYASIKAQFTQAGYEMKEGYYVVPASAPPYRDLSSNKVVGMVTLIMLKDDTCTTCFDVSVNKGILTKFGMHLESTETYEAATTSAQALIKKYGLEKLPAILVSPDAQYYPAFMNAWKQVGTEEDDGWYVMRSPDVLGTYKNLKTGEVTNPFAQAAAEE